MQFHYKAGTLREFIIEMQVAVEFICNEGTSWKQHSIILGKVSHLGKRLECDIASFIRHRVSDA